MVTTAIIAFKEFLEAFFLIGVFIGIDRKLHLGKQKEILTAAGTGICLSLIFPIVVFLFASGIKITEKNEDMLEGYLLTFSGFFLVYVVFSLHSGFHSYRKRAIASARAKMEQQIFDVTLFFTIALFVVREGFEIAILIASTSLFSDFAKNMAGLMLGFCGATLVGSSTVLAYIQLPVKKVFQYTQYCILFIGAAMVKNGVSLLAEAYMKIRLENYFPLPLYFLPSDSSIFGQALKNIFGLEQNMSVIQLGLMGAYVIGVSYLFLFRESPVADGA